MESIQSYLNTDFALTEPTPSTVFSSHSNSRPPRVENIFPGIKHFKIIITVKFTATQIIHGRAPSSTFF